MDRTKSDTMHSVAVEHLVGGVNSPVRAFKSVHGNPIYFDKASGAHVTDIDGNVLVDFVQSWGPLIHGHSHPEIINVVHEKMLNGTSFGAPHLGEIELAKKVKKRFTHMDKVRFVSSGTEAVMSAVRLARGYTGRDLLVKFEGCYHGHVDSLMVSSGSGLATFGIASSPGIPNDTVATTLICPLDDIEAVEFLFREHGQEIAAVVIEPLPANNGLLIQRNEYLSRLRQLCDEHGSLLIFDEVISGFRFKNGSYSDICGVTPDITALGKVIGGGLPVGAYGARDEIMQQLSPLGPVYQAGTLSGNPLAMAAGAKTLDLLDDDAYDYLEHLGAIMEEKVQSVLENTISQCVWFEWRVCFGSHRERRACDSGRSDTKRCWNVVRRCSPRVAQPWLHARSVCLRNWFPSTSHNESHILGFVEALDDSLTHLDWS